MSNKKSIILTLIFIYFSVFSTSYAENIIWWVKITINDTENKIVSTETKITTEAIFNYFANFYEWKVPNSYKYIKVNFKWVEKWSKLEESLQKLIYLNLIENPNRDILKDEELNSWSFFRLSEKIFWIKINDSENKETLINRKINKTDLSAVTNFINDKWIEIDTFSNRNSVKQKINVLKDVYETILTWHYDKDEFTEEEIIDAAITWVANWANDKHTVYFPPIESESFQDWLNWDYEWIWAYVDMEKPGSIRILSPIPWSPSEKAWIKWWDLVTKVDWREITEKNSLLEVINWIKWPKWSTTELTIDRNWEIMLIKVIRDRIIITDIESELLNSTTYLIHIKSFWEHVSADFKKTLENINENKNIKKIIIDLRNNWGWYLSEVTEMLSYFVPKWENTAVVKYHDYNKTFESKWYELTDFSKYKIVILQNSWTASASEILIWTLKDYYKDIILIWEKSYWKGSVQVMKNYSDGSLLKYTIAKWFTWLTETWIDWVWIEPTIPLELDIEKYKINWFDNQLDKAINIR